MSIDEARRADDKAQADLKTSHTLGIEGPALRAMERKAREAEFALTEEVARQQRRR